MTKCCTSTALACSLTDAEHKDRRTFVRQRLLPEVVHAERKGLSVQLSFERSTDIESNLKLFVEAESECCGFLSFEHHVGEDEITLSITGPDGSEAVLSKFYEGFRAGIDAK